MDRPTPKTLPVGQVLLDFRITGIIGSGSFGITYRARDESLHRSVAIKEYIPQQFAYRDEDGAVRPRSQGDDELFNWGLQRFIEEARALARFRHPNIISVNRFFERNSTAYLVMEYEEGEDLQQWLIGHEFPDEHVLVQEICSPLLNGLAKVHAAGLLHRDIKPANIFLRRDRSPVLLDFGASRPHGGDPHATMTTIVSAGYSPLEQYGRGRNQGPWTDLYAFSGTMYRAISGSAPTGAIERQQGAPHIPAVRAGAGRYSAALLRSIDQGLALDIKDRPKSADEFMALLKRHNGRRRTPDSEQTKVRPSRNTRAGNSSAHRSWAITGACMIVAFTTAVQIVRQSDFQVQTQVEESTVTPAGPEGGSAEEVSLMGLAGGAAAESTTPAAMAAELDMSECTYPDAPDVPDGASATEEEMGQAGSEVREYVSSVQGSLQCLSEVEADLGESITPKQQLALVSRYNQGVDEMNAVAENYNKQVRTFRKR